MTFCVYFRLAFFILFSFSFGPSFFEFYFSFTNFTNNSLDWPQNDSNRKNINKIEFDFPKSSVIFVCQHREHPLLNLPEQITKPKHKINLI
jgi:hypothetical protein